MSVQEAARYAGSDYVGTVAASGTKVVTLDPGGAATVGLVIKNTGAADIDSVTIEKSPLGNLYGPDTTLGTTVGTIAAGASKLLQISAKGFASIRITLVSTTGTTYAMEGKAVY